MDTTPLFFFNASFFVVTSVNVVIIMAAFIFFMVKNSYVIVKTYANHFTVLQVFFASLDMWICFFTINRVDPFDYFKWNFGCIMWNYWFQYILGIVPWLLIQHFKTIRHGFIFNGTMNRIDTRKRNFLTAIYIIGCNIPAMILCGIITIYYDIVDSSIADFGCGIDYRLRLSFLGWVLLQFMVMMITTFLIHRGIEDVYAKDYDSIKHIAVYGLITSITIFIIQNLQLELQPKWRFAYVCIRCSFFLFAFFRSIGYTLVKSITSDNKYLYKTCNTFAFYDVVINSIKDLSYSNIMTKHFLEWVVTKKTRTDTRFDQRGAKKMDRRVTIDPNKYVKIYKRIREWRYKYEQTRLEKERTRLKDEGKSILKEIGTANIEFSKAIKRLMKQARDDSTKYKDVRLILCSCEMFFVDTFDFIWGDEYLASTITWGINHTNDMKRRATMLIREINELQQVGEPISEEDQSSDAGEEPEGRLLKKDKRSSRLVVSDGDD